MNNDYLDHLMGCYFNQDYDLSGETIPEIMQCYLDNESSEMARGLLRNIEIFIGNAEDIESAFDELYHYDFSPSLWGITAAEFLRLVSEQAKRHILATKR